jgi:hypothetical protein
MAERDSDPDAMLADKGYDSDAIRQDLLDRGAAEYARYVDNLVADLYCLSRSWHLPWCQQIVLPMSATSGRDCV